MGFAASSLLHPGCFGNPKSPHDARADMVGDGLHSGALPQAFPLLAMTEREHGWKEKPAWSTLYPRESDLSIDTPEEGFTSSVTV